MKFGGSSVEDAAAIRRVAAIIRARLGGQPVVVVSAIGQTTDRLIEVARLAADGDREGAHAKLAGLLEHHLEIVAELAGEAGSSDLESAIETAFEELADLATGLSLVGELTGRSLDAVMSFGERLSSAILAGALAHAGVEVALLDSRRIIVTDETFTRAVPDTAAIAERAPAEVGAVVGAGKVAVLQGFIGASHRGIPTTIGRGGSDYTAALIGAALGVGEIQIWTDVDGLMTADPRIVRAARVIPSVTFQEAAELAYFGARVLHPSTILPAVSLRIPVRILNSRRAPEPGAPATASAGDLRGDDAGTLVLTERRRRADGPVTAIASKSGVTVVNIVSTRMLMAHGFLRAIFEIFDRHRLVVDVVATSEVSVSLTLDEDAGLEAAVAELSRIAEITIDRGRAIVCVVGTNLKSIAGLAARAFHAVGDINLEMISQGASRINMSFVVAADDAERAVRRLHAEFFERAEKPMKPRLAAKP